MIDIRPHVAELLASLNAQIEPEYRDTFVTFPLIVLTEIDNAGTISDCTEVYSTITLQVDSYTLDKKETLDLAASVDEILTANGFKRRGGRPLKDGELERYTATYDVYVYKQDTIMTN